MKSNTRLVITLVSLFIVFLTIADCSKAFMKKSTEATGNI